MGECVTVVRLFDIDTHGTTQPSPTPPIALIHLSKGEVLAELGRADASPLREAGWVQPERVMTKGEDGLTDIYGIVLKPNGNKNRSTDGSFDGNRNGPYPVVEQTYAGPHGSHCPKGFRYCQLAQLPTASQPQHPKTQPTASPRCNYTTRPRYHAIPLLAPLRTTTPSLPHTPPHLAY